MLPRCITCCYVGVYGVTVIVLECSSCWQHLFLRLQLLRLILTVRESCDLEFYRSMKLLFASLGSSFPVFFVIFAMVTD